MRRNADRSDRAARPPARLVALCVLINLGETGVVVALGISGGAAVALQSGAPPPLGLFSDLRWLLVYERSWATFAAGVVALLLVRSLLSALQVRLAWPGTAPAFGRLLARALVFNVALGLLLAPFALLLFGLAAIPISWLYFAAVPAVIVFSLLLFEGGIAARWWRHAPALRPIGWMTLTVLGLTAAAGLTSVEPELLALPVAVLAGLFEAVAWKRIVDGVVLREERHFLPLAPLLVVTFLTGAVLGAANGFAAAKAPPTPRVDTVGRVVPEPGRRAVLVASGFSSHSGGGPATLAGAPSNDDVVGFSYRASATDGEPDPYSALDTHRSLARLAHLMARQVAELASSSGEKVSIVAVSEGAAVTEDYLALTRDPPVKTVVLISPLLEPGTVSYPLAGHDGWGMVAGQGLDLLSTWLAPISAVDLSPNQPFLRSLIAEHSLLRPDPSCQRTCKGPKLVEIVPLADTVAGAPSSRRGVAVMVVTGFHGANDATPAVQRALGEALSGEAVATNSTETALSHVIAGLASAWRVPSLYAGLS